MMTKRQKRLVRITRSKGSLEATITLQVVILYVDLAELWCMDVHVLELQLCRCSCVCLNGFALVMLVV